MKEKLIYFRFWLIDKLEDLTLWLDDHTARWQVEKGEDVSDRIIENRRKYEKRRW